MTAKKKKISRDSSMDSHDHIMCGSGVDALGIYSGEANKVYGFCGFGRHFFPAGSVAYRNKATDARIFR